jgi:hypothetical protein
MKHIPNLENMTVKQLVEYNCMGLQCKDCVFDARPEDEHEFSWCLSALLSEMIVRNDRCEK